MGEEKTKPALLLEEGEKVEGEALLGLGGGKRIPCVGVVKVPLARFSLDSNLCLVFSYSA